MVGHDIIVVGASAGGVEALEKLICALSPLPAAIFVVLHVPAHGKSVLPEILNRALKRHHQGKSSWCALHPHDGELIKEGQIYIAPPNNHLVIHDGYVKLRRGPRENSHRPAVDPLFRTAARTYRQRVVGIVLSGALDDGTAGLMAIKQQGGVAIAQDPAEALYNGMPRSAIENVEVDHILRISDIATVLGELVNTPVVVKDQIARHDLEVEADMAELELDAMQNTHRPGKPSPFGCPDCGGVLWEIDEGKLIRFRCRTGHAYSTDTLLAEQSDALEEALWNALRALEEKAALAERMAQRARDRNQPYSTKRFDEHKEQAQARAALVRQLLLKGDNDISTVNGLVGTQEMLNGSQSAQQATPAPALDDAAQMLTMATNDVVSANAASFYVVALCASAGGLKALGVVLSALPPDFPAAIVIVQHLHPDYPSHLAAILERQTHLHVKQAQQGDVLHPGNVYIAPPNNHLLVTPEFTISLSKAALVHFSRPSVDLLLESMAMSFKENAIAAILTGMGSDGAIGIKAIKHMGGITIAQNEASSEFFSMPKAANDTGSVDFVVPLDQIATTLVKLVTRNDQATPEL